MKIARRKFSHFVTSVVVLTAVSRVVATIGFAVALAAPMPSEAAEIKVLTTRAMNHALTELAGGFRRTSEHKVTLILAPPNEVRSRIVNGEIVDVAISGGATIDDLARQGRIARDGTMILARVGIGVAVRAGAVKPDISTVEAFRRTLLAAKSIVYTDPATGGSSGIHFEKVLDRLGIAQEIKHRLILNARPATVPSAEIVARGEAELGIQLISEIVLVPGAELLGPLPGDLQAMTVVSAGLVAAGREKDAAGALFKFLASPAAAAIIRATGMEPGS